MKFDILIFNGYTYEYETTIEAKSVNEARKYWIENSSPSQRYKFKVRKVK